MYNQSGVPLKFPGTTACIAPRDVFYFFDDFMDCLNSQRWGFIPEHGGTYPIDDTVGGEITLTTCSGDNDGCLLHGLSEVFKIASGKPLYFAARVTIAEANTDDLDFAIGLTNNIVPAGAANTALLGDSGGALPASYDGVLFHKSESTSVWNFESSAGAAQVTDSSVADCETAGVYLLEFEYDGNTTITAKIDGTTVAIQTITAAMLVAASELCPVIALKADSANAESVAVDYVYYAQLR